jgi:fumarate hydratase subunit alpha
MSRSIEYQQIVQAVRQACMDAAFELPRDVLNALSAARAAETNARAQRILDQLLENAALASADCIPICQDTGLVVVFVEQGADLWMEPPADRPAATLNDAINEGVAAGYQEGYLRKSVVAEPLNQRRNTTTNTPAIIHHTVIAGDKLHLSLMAKGGGCENKSQFRMFNPTASESAVKDWIIEVVKTAGPNACPPFVVGIGLGGNFELSCLLSKKALLRDIGTVHPDPFYATLEKDFLEAVNATGLGPQGLGGDTTALAVHIETAACHIASLPVAVNIECHAHRHAHLSL